MKGALSGIYEKRRVSNPSDRSVISGDYTFVPVLDKAVEQANQKKPQNEAVVVFFLVVFVKLYLVCQTCKACRNTFVKSKVIMAAAYSEQRQKNA